MMHAKKIYRSAYLLLGALLLMLGVGCTKQLPGEDDNADLNLQISAQALMNQTTHGIMVNNIRIIAVKIPSGLIVYNKTTADGGITDIGGVNGIGVFNTSLKPGNYRLYVIGNETPAMTTLLNSAQLESALEPITVPNDLTEENLVLVKSRDIEVRIKPGFPTDGEVSTDGGSSWSSLLSMVLDRAVAKVTLKIAKDTPNPNDQLVIHEVQLIHLPEYSFLITQPYMGALQTPKVVFTSVTGISYDNTTPTDLFKPIFADVIIPEYQLPLQSEENAIALYILATYNNLDVTYTIPLRGDLLIPNYDILRNKHYVVNLTIIQKGQFDYHPYITYQVMPWTDTDPLPIDISENAQFSGVWAAGTTFVNPNEIAALSNGYVEFDFTLLGADGMTWTAGLTNGLDFGFDYSGGAISSGTVTTGPNKIRIKPLRNVYVGGIKTELFILLNNGVRNFEIDLNHDGFTGTGKRYVVNQIPL